MKSGFLLVGILLVALAVLEGAQANDWSTHGRTKNNTRYTTKSQITSANAHLVRQKWVDTFGGWVTGTPTVSGPRVYSTSFDGNVYCVSAYSGVVFWQVSLAAITGVQGDFARSSPALWDKYVVVGTQKSHSLVALNAVTGTLIWHTQLGDHPLAIITASPVVWNGDIYTGTASNEEAAAANPEYPCCSFVGSAYRVRLSDGLILWEVPMIAPEIPTGLDGYSGVGVWAAPAIDRVRNTVYFGTGNVYKYPADVQQCINDTVAFDNGTLCIADGVLFDSIIALRIWDGDLVWSHRLNGPDAWTVACFFGGPNCPPNPGPDADFGMSPLIAWDPTRNHDILLVAQKSGIAYGINPDNGDLYWATQVGPGGSLGGSSWGASCDGEKYYLGTINNYHEAFELLPPTDAVIYGGAWSALNISTGEILMQLADPAALSDDEDLIAASSAVSPPSVVNDVLVVASTDPLGTVYLIDTSTFTILKSFTTGGSVYGGASISGNCIYIGSGYNPLFNPQWTSNTQLYAFCL